MANGIKGTIWFLEIYEDDANFRKYKQNIEEQYEWVSIRHDKDVNPETGELKKPHIHYLIKTANTADISTISYRTQVPENYIKVRSSYKFAFRYLVHADQPDKTAYKWEELQGVDVKRQIQRYLQKDEGTAVTEIIDLIGQCKFNRLSYAMFIRQIVVNELWGYFRQAQATYRQLWDEAKDDLYYTTPRDEVKSDNEF